MDPCACAEGWYQGWGGASMRCLGLLLLRDGMTEFLVMVCIMQQLDDDHSSAGQVDLCLALHAQHILCDFSALSASPCLHFLVSQMDLTALLGIWNTGKIIQGPVVGVGGFKLIFTGRSEIILFHQKNASLFTFPMEKCNWPPKGHQVMTYSHTLVRVCSLPSAWLSFPDMDRRELGKEGVRGWRGGDVLLSFHTCLWWGCADGWTGLS